METTDDNFEPNTFIITQHGKKWMIALRQFDVTGNEYDIVGTGETREDAIKDALVNSLQTLTRVRRAVRTFCGAVGDDDCLNNRCFLTPLEVETVHKDSDTVHKDSDTVHKDG